MNPHQHHPIAIALQRALDHSFDPIRQLFVAIDMVVCVDPNLHLASAQFVTSIVNVAKNMPHGHPSFVGFEYLLTVRNGA